MINTHHRNGARDQQLLRGRPLLPISSAPHPSSAPQRGFRMITRDGKPPINRLRRPATADYRYRRATEALPPTFNTSMPHATTKPHNRHNTQTQSELGSTFRMAP